VGHVTFWISLVAERNTQAKGERNDADE